MARHPADLDGLSAAGLDAATRGAVGWHRVGLKNVEELGTVVFVLGQPVAHHQAYERAKTLLRLAPSEARSSTNRTRLR